MQPLERFMSGGTRSRSRSSESNIGISHHVGLASSQNRKVLNSSTLVSMIRHISASEPFNTFRTRDYYSREHRKTTAMLGLCHLGAGLIRISVRRYYGGLNNYQY